MKEKVTDTLMIIGFSGAMTIEGNYKLTIIFLVMSLVAVVLSNVWDTDIVEASDEDTPDASEKTF